MPGPVERTDDTSRGAGRPAGVRHTAALEGGAQPTVGAERGQDRQVDRVGQTSAAREAAGRRTADDEPGGGDRRAEVGTHREDAGDGPQVARRDDEHGVAGPDQRLPRHDGGAVQVEHERSRLGGERVQHVGDDGRLGRPRSRPVRAQHGARAPAGQQGEHVRAGHLAARVRQVRPPHAVGSLEPEQDVDAGGRPVEVDQDRGRPAGEVPGDGGGERRRARASAAGHDADDERAGRVAAATDGQAGWTGRAPARGVIGTAFRRGPDLTAGARRTLPRTARTRTPDWTLL